MKSPKNVSRMVVAGLLCTLAAGCFTEFGGDARDGEMACLQEKLGYANGYAWNAMWDNGLWGNGLWDNGLWNNALGFNGIWDNGTTLNGTMINGFLMNGLAWNGISFNGMHFNGLSEVLADPSARQTFEYLVSCALTAEQQVEVEIEGEQVVFPGGIGLAPEWQKGPCKQDCQELVSACMISRVNYRGESILISLRGNHPALAPEEGELEVFSWEEGTYYGNIFTEPQQFLACLPDHSNELLRVCGPHLSDCFLEVVDRCSRICRDGVCQDAEGRIYRHTITVFRPPEEVLKACH